MIDQQTTLLLQRNKTDDASMVQTRRNSTRLAVILAATIFLPLPGVATQLAQAQEATVIDVRKEYSVKGAFLYSFGRYTSWPKESFTSPSEPFVIGVLGDAPIYPILRRIEQTKQINRRRISIRRLKTAEATNPCHIVFVARTVPREEQQALIRRHSKSPVLLVGETTDFTRSGGVIRFFVNEGSVRFEINVQAARRKHFSFDAKLLRLARVIESDKESTASSK